MNEPGTEAVQELPNPLIEKTTQSLLLIKPHATQSGAEVEIRTFLERNKFTILGQQRFILTDVIINQMYRSEFDLKELTGGKRAALNGPVLVLIVSAVENTLQRLWSLVGHEDPGEAKLGTLRYMYGVTRDYNAIYAPKTESEFRLLRGIFELWQSIFLQALNVHDAEPLEWARKKFMEMTGQVEGHGTGISVEEPKQHAEAPPAPLQVEEEDPKDETIDRLANSDNHGPDPAGSLPDPGESPGAAAVEDGRGIQHDNGVEG